MRLALALVLGGCGFHVAAGASDDDGTPSDGPAPPVDVPGEVIGACGSPKIWQADFTADPRTLDVNGDGVLDWAIRQGMPMPGVMQNGVWTEPAPPIAALDTQPKQNFTTRTKIRVRMQNDVAGGTYGAVFWINVGYGDADFAPIWIDLNKQPSGSQDLTLYTKNPALTPITLATASGLGAGMVDVVLDLDPAAHVLFLQVAALPTVGPISYTEIPTGGTDDRWATITAFSTQSEFDLVRIEVCP